MVRRLAQMSEGREGEICDKKVALIINCERRMHRHVTEVKIYGRVIIGPERKRSATCTICPDWYTVVRGSAKSCGDSSAYYWSQMIYKINRRDRAKDDLNASIRLLVRAEAALYPPAALNGEHAGAHIGSHRRVIFAVREALA